MSSEMLNRLLGNIPDGTVDKSAGSFVYDVNAPLAVVLSELLNELEKSKDKMFVRNLTGDELTLRAAEHGINRKLAAYSTGRVHLTGTGSINIGDLFETSNKTQFRAVNNVQIENSGFVNVEALVPGSMGNVNANSISLFPVTLSGFTAVTNPEPTSGGYDEESDESLKNRYYLEVPKRPGTGNPSHYKKIAMEVPGVADVKIFRAWNGPGTAKLVLLSEEKRTPSASIIEEVQQRVDDMTPINDPVITVVGVTEVMISVSATLTLKSGGIIDNARLQAKEALSKYLYDIAFVDQIVRYAKTGEAILSADDVLDYTDLKINNGSANVELQGDQIPILGVLNLSIGG
ncbi:baseplate J/gp47 family protein [Virgibacillus siamensis]|uniref:baseplate J/gp47 family protein n=2 Tax=Bacillati TaxID=1783272 RepID=UPI003637C2D9